MDKIKSFKEVRAEATRKQQDNQTARRAMWLPFRRFWLLYVALTGTAILSMFAGAYIGLAPSKDGEVIFINALDVLRRVFFAAFFMISFISVAEGATLFWETKMVYHDVDENGQTNSIQIWTSRVALAISIFAVVGTSLAAAYFLSAWLGALDKYAEVPAFAQGWVVWSMPLLLVFHATSAIIYWYNSAEAALDRHKNTIRRATQAEMAEIEANAWREEYQRISPELAKAKGRALARKAAMEDFYSTEEKANADLNGDGFVGRPPARREIPEMNAPTHSSTYKEPPVFGPSRNNGHHPERQPVAINRLETDPTPGDDE